ncbi:surface lipoprotein assembly modifier [Neptuniibacter sp.]|uniref:surface lipoprotein assembly modifier n=1 Tax=Neptuniibacter sp. TaxID=1962643 RepID=UPI003B5916BB
MLRKILLHLIAIWVFVSSNAHADLSQIQALLDENKAEQAYKIASSLLDEYEGVTEFDLMYGSAAVDSGNVSEGVFALERVLLVEPDNNLAKLELARGYFFLQQYELSETLFVEVKGQNPPPLVQARINTYLARINQQQMASATRFNSFIELWAGYDNNINSSPDGQTNVVTLTADALGRGEQYNQVRAGITVDHDYSIAGSLFFSGSADMRFYHTEDEQDYKSFNFSGGHRWNLDKQQYQLGVTIQNYDLGYEDYRTLLGLNFGWNKQLSKRSVLRTTLSLNDLSYDQTTYKDASQLTLSTNYLYAGQNDWKPVWFAGLFIGDEDPDTAGVLANAEVDRKFYGGSFGVQLSPSSSMVFTSSLVYQVSDYRGEDWIYNIKRKDEYSSFNLNAEWRVQKNWSLLMNYNYALAESNIELFEYDRQQVMLGMRYNFN